MFRTTLQILVASAALLAALSPVRAEDAKPVEAKPADAKPAAALEI